MDKKIKSVIAVTLLVLSILVGTNFMVAKESNTSWLMWTFLFLAGAVLFWLWIKREESSSSDTADSAMDFAEKQVDKMTAIVEDRVPEVKKEPVVKQATPAPEVKTEAAKPVAPVAVEVKKEETSQPEQPVAVTTQEKATRPDTGELDDLSRIEGIGPKYADILISAGITSFKKLAALSEAQIVDIVREGGGRKSASMATWQEQAKLAAAGDWDGLARLQESLSGGRR